MTDTTTLPPNPYAAQGSLSEAWERGFAGLQMLATEGSNYASVYAEGKNAAVAFDAGRRAALAQSAQPALDPEPLIHACIPGGSVCDPQQVADAIRRYLDSWSQSAQAPAPLNGHWRLERIDGDQIAIEAEGMAYVVASKLSHEPMEMLLAHMAEDLLSAQAPAPEPPIPPAAQWAPGQPAQQRWAAQAPAQPAPSVEAVMALVQRLILARDDVNSCVGTARDRRTALEKADAALRSAVEALARGAR